VTDASDDDDDRLKSLRAVWLSLPEEEPPERGFADLMAAARVKAEQMSAAAAGEAKPSLWQRFLDSMRRPPVLALATVMVLIGGAVLVGRHGDEMESSPTVAPTQSAPESSTTAPVAEPPASPPVAPAGAVAPMEAAPAKNDSADPAPLQGVAGGDMRGGAEASKGGAVERRPAKKTSRPAAGEPPPPPQELERPVAEAQQTTQLFDDDEPLKHEEPKAGATTAPRREPSASADAAKAPEPTSISKLHSIARAAAARGDCDTARSLVRRIASVDPGYYQKKIVNDPALSACNVAQ
jgi:hypothetical protein